jgi:hypothetical protein
MFMRHIVALIAACSAALAVQDSEKRMGTRSTNMACEALRHQEEYVGRRLISRGVVTQHEHAMYFVPTRSAQSPKQAQCNWPNAVESTAVDVRAAR